MIDLDEMKTMWAKHDRVLAANLRVNWQLLNRTKSAIQRLVVGLTLESILNFAAIVALGGFTYDHRNTARFALPAAALDVFAIVILGCALRLITFAVRIDFGNPIGTIQRQLGSLRMLRIRVTQWTLLAAPLIWTPLLIVWLKGNFGIDAYRAFGSAYLLANLLFGLAVIPVALWVSRRFGDRMGRSPILQRLSRSLAGYNLNAAVAFLATLSEFENEQPDS